MQQFLVHLLQSDSPFSGYHEQARSLLCLLGKNIRVIAKVTFAFLLDKGLQGALVAPEPLQAKLLGIQPLPENCQLIDNRLWGEKIYPVVIKSKGLANSTRPKL